MKYLHVEKPHASILIIKPAPIEITIHNLNEAHAEMEHLLLEKGVHIFDLREAKFISSEIRIKMGNWLKQREPIFKQNVFGTYFLIHSLSTELVLKGIFFISKPPTAYKVGRRQEEAIEWAHSVLAKRI